MSEAALLREENARLRLLLELVCEPKPLRIVLDRIAFARNELWKYSEQRKQEAA